MWIKFMWIKWKYMDHGFGDYRELEIPDNAEEDYGSVPAYLCEANLGIPTWGERFMMSRIHWEKLKLPKAEIKRREIARLRSAIDYHTRELAKHKAALHKNYEKGM